MKRLSAIYGEAFVAGVAKELADAREAVYTSESGMDEAVAAIHKRFTYRMQDLAEFMKGLLQRFTQWFNRAHSRSGTLWEDRFKSVIVEDGVAARTISAYIDLNPVRAGMVQDPADYRWSSYGEAVGGGAKGNVGVTDQIAPKAVIPTVGSVGEAVARGEGEVGLQQISELLPVPGIKVVGPLPDAVQLVTVFSAGIFSSAKEPQAARALIDHLTASASRLLYTAKGLEPAF